VLAWLPFDCSVAVATRVSVQRPCVSGGGMIDSLPRSQSLIVSRCARRVAVKWCSPSLSVAPTGRPAMSIDRASEPSSSRSVAAIVGSCIGASS
jgi:hypothetical protein